MSSKIAFLINSLINGGAERVISNLVSTLKQEGHDVELICLEKNNFYDLDESVKITYLTNSNGNEHIIKKFIMLPFLAYKLKKYVLFNDIKIVQSHLFRSNYVNSLSRLFGSNHKVQLVSTVSATSKYIKNNFTSKINLFLIKKLYKYADLLVFKANAMRDDYINNFNLTNKNIVINNPIDIDKIDKLKYDSSDSIFNFDKNKKYIVSMGRFHKQKRQIVLVKAFEKIHKKYDTLEIIFLGDGEEREDIQRYVKHMGLGDKIHFLGNVKNPYYYLFNSNIYISTSTSEGFPNALVEAMCCELPAISTDCMTGPREILAPNTNYKKLLDEGTEETKFGLLVAVEDIEALEKSIDIMMDKNKYVDYKLFLRDRINVFSFKKILDKYKKILI